MPDRDDMLDELRAEVAADKAAADAYAELRREKNRRWHRENVRQTPERAEKDRVRRRMYKYEAVEQFGGMCNRCKGKFHPAVFEFHHTDPSTKDPNFASIMAGSPLSKVLPLLHGCEMLCANCHRVTHAELRGYEWDETSTQ